MIPWLFPHLDGWPLTTSPADWVYEYRGRSAPASFSDRLWLILSLAQLGQIQRAAENEAETIRLAEPTHHAFVAGRAHFPAGTLHLIKSDWGKARFLIDTGLQRSGPETPSSFFPLRSPSLPGHWRSSAR